MNQINTTATHRFSRKNPRRAPVRRAVAESLENRWLLTSDISGTLYRDVDLSGTYDAAFDQPLAGWTVYLDINDNGAADNAEPVVTTDDQGFYQFSGLPAGPYVVRDVVPFGWRPIVPETSRQDVGMADGITDITDVNFGNSETTLLTGAVYNDANADGVRQADEAGLAGWTIYIDADGNGLFDFGETSTLTDANGNYSLDGLDAGTYNIRIEPTVGYRLTNPTTLLQSPNLPAGTYLPNVDFGVTSTNALSGNVFIDANSSGTLDASDAPLPNWTVFIDANDNGTLDSGETSTLTDASGNYSFPALSNDTFDIKVDVPLGWSLTTPLTGSYQLAPAGGDVITGQDFGLLPAATSITYSGKVFNDINHDGLQQIGEPDMSGWLVYIDANQNGKFDSGETYTSTDSGGNYQLPPQQPGNVRVAALLPSDWYSVNPSTGYFQTIPHSSGDVVVAGTNFALSRDNVGQISGIAFEDSNFDGVFNPGEVPVAGATVYIGSIDTSSPHTVTDASGHFTFSNLAAGDYELVIDASSVQPIQSPPRLRASVYAGNVRDTTLAQDNSVVSDIEFPLTDRFAVAGTVLYDANGTGILLTGGTDQGETFMGGWAVYADFNKNGTADPGEPSAFTNADGSYYLIFPGTTLPSATVLELVMPDGWQLTTLDLTAFPPAPIPVVIQPNNVLPDYRFFVQPIDTAILYGSVFYDSNRNGFFDQNETPVTDARVYVDLNGNAQLDPNEPFVYTDGDGNWIMRQENQLFTLAGMQPQYVGLNPALLPGVSPYDGIDTGTYVVRVAYDYGVLQPANPNPSVRTVTVANNDSLMGLNFGMVPVVGLQGSVFGDLNASGQQNINEDLISDITIFLDDNNNGLLDSGETSTVTDSGGNYFFYQVAPGPHIVRELVPGGARPTRTDFYRVNAVEGTVTTVPQFASTTTGKIRGSIYIDANQNGVRDASERPLPGSDVFLDLNQNGRHDANEPITRSNPSGNYSFDALPDGTYRVMQVWATNYDPAGSLPYSDVIVPLGQLVDAPTAGNLPRPRVKGVVFRDNNADGRKQAGDILLRRVRVYVDQNRNGRYDRGELTTLTDGKGSFQLILPGAGHYVIRILNPSSGFHYSLPQTGRYRVSLGSGQLFRKAIFGLTRIRG